MKGAVRRKELVVTTTKFSIDLIEQEEDGRIITPEEMTSISMGCLETLLKLEELGEMIEVFRITWIKFDKYPLAGPNFTIYFHDPLGEKASYSADYRFIGSGTPLPTSEDIVQHFCAETCLPRYISGHLRRCAERLENAQKALPKPKLAAANMVMCECNGTHCNICGGSFPEGDDICGLGNHQLGKQYTKQNG